MGNITFTEEQAWVDSKGLLHVVGRGVFSSSYATNGDTLSISNRFRQVYDIEPSMPEDAGGYILQVTDTYWAAPASGILVEAYYFDNDLSVDGVAIEVTAATDLSSIAFRFHIIGRRA